MTFGGVLILAFCLGIERVTYAWVWHRPTTFRALCARAPFAAWKSPVDALEYLFWGFKGLQVAIFLAWCWLWGDGSVRLTPSGAAAIAGLVLVGSGQVLNLSVFHRLGKTGVFYANRFGYAVPWCSRFPFSLLRHPQYVGTLLSIWGFFLVMRFPHPDWLLLPLVETAYYTLGSYVERHGAGDSGHAHREPAATCGRSGAHPRASAPLA
jgi:methylene-fatty-acyl-phospholipid synthase